jgi:hypothetical protein
MSGGSSGRLRAAWLVTAYALLVVPAILAGGTGGSQAADFREYHWLEIQRLAEGWPAPGLRDSLTSTTPGFHLLLSIAARAGAGETAIRLLGALAGLAAWLVTWRVACRWVPGRTASLVTAPLALSPYLLGSAIWCTTEAAAVAMAAAVMGVSLVCRVSAASVVVLGVLGAGTVLVRHILVWACIPSVMGMLFADRGRDRRPLRRVTRALIVLLPAVLTIAAFMTIWGGAVPPRFQAFHQSMGNPAAPVVAVAVFGVWGLPLLPGLWRGADGGQRSLAVFAALLALVLSLTVESGYRKVLPPAAQQAGTAFQKTGDEKPIDAVVGAHQVGRWGGPLWDAARGLPVVGGRSLAVVGMAAVGGAVLALLWSAAQLRGRGLQAAWLLAAMAGMALSQAANAQTFQRYFDPWVLLAIGWLVAMGLRPGAVGHRLVRAGVWLLAVVQLGMSAVAVLGPAVLGPSAG